MFLEEAATGTTSSGYEGRELRNENFLGQYDVVRQLDLSTGAHSGEGLAEVAVDLSTSAHRSEGLAEVAGERAAAHMEVALIVFLMFIAATLFAFSRCLKNPRNKS